MRKQLFKWGMALLTISTLALTTGCGSSDTSNASSTSENQNTASASSTQSTVDPKTAYIQKLNDAAILNDLKVISSYGLTVQKLDVSNENDVKGLHDVDQTGIPKYTKLAAELNKMNVPNDYKAFHKLLVDSITNFVGTMKEMDLYLKDTSNTDHLTKSTAHYIVSTESLNQLAKKLPFNELQ